MSLADSVGGSAFFLCPLAAAVAAAILLTRKRYDHLRGIQRGVAISVLATTALIFSYVIPAALTILTRTSALVASLAVVLAAWRVPATVTREQGARPEPEPSSVASIVIAVIALTAMLVYELARVRNYATHLPVFIDSVGFHLPGVATWIQTHSLWRVDQFEPGFATAQYPNNGDFLLLAAVLPWHDLALARLAMLPFYALMGVGTYALALQLGARRAAAVTFAAAALTVQGISRYAFEGIPDLVTLSMLPIGLLFLARHARTRMNSDLVMGGLALGLSFGAKWYGVTSIAVVVVVWVATWLLLRRPLAETARRTGIGLGMIAAGGGIWLVRNLIESGNPIYPKAVKLLGVTIFPGSANDVINRYGFSIVHYLTAPSVLSKYIYPGFRDALGITGIVLLFALAVVGVHAVRSRPGRGADRNEAVVPAMLVVLTLGILVTYVITPGTAYGPPNHPTGGYPTLRWLMPAVVVGAPLAALAVSRLGRYGLLLELAGLACVFDGISRGDQISTKLIVEVLLVLALAAALVLIVRRPPLRERLTLPRTAFAAAGVALLALFSIAGIRILQQNFNRNGYAAYGSVFAWIDDHAPSGHRVGITGEASANGLAPVLPMAGPRLGNEIGYVGDPSVHSLELPRSEHSFRADLARGHYDLLEIGLQDSGHTDAWARAMGYHLVASSPELALYAAPSAFTAQVAHRGTGGS